MNELQKLLLPSKDDISKIISKNIVIVKNCWIWKSAKDTSGYGIICRGKNGKKCNFQMHRLSAYAYLDYDFESSLLVLHKIICNNASCVNPDHLYLGTHNENSVDVVISGNHWQSKKTHCKHGHEFTSENTALKGGKRRCRTCYKEIYNVKKSPTLA